MKVKGQKDRVELPDPTLATKHEGHLHERRVAEDTLPEC
jgi:hypothetical protein